MTGGPTAADELRETLSDLKVDLRVYVPGYPITDAVPALGEEATMATNEKVAMEVALGASATGRRSIVLVKHLGVNLLADPLSISPTHTIGAGLVVLAGEDVGPKGSQAEMDVRNYGPSARCRFWTHGAPTFSDKLFWRPSVYPRVSGPR